MPGAHSKLGFRVKKLKPKAGGKPVKGSSIPLILPNDMKYNAATGGVERVPGAQRTGLYVVPEALDLLEGIEEPVSVLAICGPCRTGKSYILSRMLGTADAFALGHRMDPETFGIWMGTKVLRGKDFTIVLLDTEGIDAAGASAGQDASILVLTILLSSQLIYNSQNVPRKGDLEKMQSFINLAKGITVKQGKRADKPEVSALRKFFPDFLWLLRDVALKMEDDHGNEIHPTEYLKTKVLGIQHEKGSTSDKVRQAILNFFPSVECATLEAPTGDADIMNSIAQNTDNLNPRFNKGVQNLIEMLIQKARPKRGFHEGSTVNGEALSIMTRQYVEAVNDPNAIPALDNTWQNTVELMRGRAIEEAVMNYKKQMQILVAEARRNWEGPLEEDGEIGRSGLYRTQRRWTSLFQPSQPALIDLHNEQFEKVKNTLLKKVGHLSPGVRENRTVVDKLQNRLVQREKRAVTGGELFHIMQQNKEHSKNFCKKLSEQLLDPIRKRVKSPPTYDEYDPSQLRIELRHARQQYEELARGPEKGAVLQEMTVNCEQLETDFRRLEEHHKELMRAKQKTREAELRARERERQLQQLRQQAQDMPRAHREILQKMEEEHRKMMEEAAQGVVEERQKKYQKLLESLMEEQMKMIVEEFDSAMKLEVQRMKQQIDSLVAKKLMECLSEAVDDLPAPRAPVDDGCIIS